MSNVFRFCATECIEIDSLVTELFKNKSGENFMPQSRTS